MSRHWIDKCTLRIAADHRGEFVRQDHLSPTRGYGTLNYELTGFKPSKLAKLRILVNCEEVVALTCAAHHDKAEHRGRAIIKRMRQIGNVDIPQKAFLAVLGGNDDEGGD